MSDVALVFKQREQAIKTKDQTLYELTQLNSSLLWQGNFSQYRLVEDIKIELLAEAEEEIDFSKYVFVKETCTFEDERTHIRFAMYGLIHTVKGWKVNSIASLPLPFDTIPKKTKKKK